MLITELKSWEEILELLKGEKRVFLLGCSGCAEVCETGGEKVLQEAKEKLEAAGKEVVATLSIDLLCNKALVGIRLSRHLQEVKDSDSLLVMSCGVGVQAVSAMVNKPIFPLCNTLSLGGFRGLWHGEERCGQCGNCILEITGGICPITSCSKGLLSGPCGGAKDGKCEIDPEKDCGWALIYERLKGLRRLDNLAKPVSPRNYGKMEPSASLRKGPFWAVEQEGKKGAVSK